MRKTIQNGKLKNISSLQETKPKMIRKLLRRQHPNHQHPPRKTLTNLRRKTKTKGAGLEVEVVTVVEVTVEVTEIKIITIGGPPPISDVQFMRGCPYVLPNELTDLLDLEC